MSPAQDEFQALLEAAVDGIVVIDELGQVAAFNAAAERLFGYAAAEVIGNNVSMLMPNPYRDEHDGYLANYRNTGIPRIIGSGREAMALRKDGSEFPIYLAVGESIGSAGRRFVGIIRDLSERRQYEERLRQNRERLAHVGRISLMGEMAAGLAHEINQPLGAIANYAQAARRLLAAGDDTAAAEATEALDHISMQALRAGDVIRRLRTMIRKRDSEPAHVDINSVVQGTLPLVDADARANGVRLRVELTPDLAPVRCDVVQIQQVLLNLVRNAVDAMHAAGSSRRQVVIRTTRAGAEVIAVEVADTGPGIDSGIVAQLFTPFHTTKSDGLGLGLSISRSLVEEHGGELRFRANEPQGAAFVFTLPVVAADHDD